MPQDTKAAAPATPADGSPSLAGWSVDLNDPSLAREALDKAFDYRGDITLTLDDDTELAGYLYDRKQAGSLDASTVRVLCPGSDDPVTVTYDRVRRVRFSDRDPAAGKSFETWVKKYVEKKLKGEAANIESEPLDADT